MHRIHQANRLRIHFIPFHKETELRVSGGLPNVYQPKAPDSIIAFVLLNPKITIVGSFVRFFLYGH